MKKRNNNIFLLILMSILLLILVGCTTKEKTEEKEQGGTTLELKQLQLPNAGEEVAVITTNHGEIKLRLFPEVAPKAVENFKTHAKDGYYDGVTFHRVMKDFMIQGGDPQGTGRGGESIWGKPFEDEFSKEYLNIRGALSMANAGPKTNGSQFFIVQLEGGTPWLNGGHTVFGQVYEGMDVVDKIAAVKVDRNSKPKDDVIMEKVEIVEYK